MFLVSLSGTATVQHISKIKHSVLVLLQLLSHFNNFPRPISSFLCHFQFSTLQRPITCLVSLSVQHTPKTHHLSCVTFSSAHSKDPSPVLCHFQFSTLQRPISSFLCHFQFQFSTHSKDPSPVLCHFQFSTLQRPIICLLSLSVQHTPKTHHLSLVTFSSAHSKDPSSVSCHFQFITFQTKHHFSCGTFSSASPGPLIFLVSLLALHTPKTKHFLYPWHYV